ncbi:hypothetical protein HH310_26980 [Actinoplanes sp. TBRC 11911]|uniref:hypothetical protein n=1 Tax=Actinoplanes sp. TBRC 11911 TaxID=2729386 RepID=UPI00145C83FF|nr:hypothetical protein [Actinoplanes sp. TBRC 11911]NMO54816.1 hypothetical protein [Actinoplanes sp. TBRC 11911]
MNLLLSCATLLLMIAAAGSCDKPSKSDMWLRIPLPDSAGATLRDVAACDGRWLAVGGKDGAPAAWRGPSAGASPPGTAANGASAVKLAFTPLPGSFYGPLQQIGSVACATGRVAMLGAVPGGAHGNPRVSTWRLDGDVMRENAAPFETYGGDEAVDVNRVEAGRAGFAIAGNRTSGAAAWFSADGKTFMLTEKSDTTTVARDVVPLPDGRWMVVGGSAIRGSADQEPAAWIATVQPPTDLPAVIWRAADPPASTGYNELQRAVRYGDDVIAAGIRGTRFATWRWHAGTWSAQDPYDEGDPGGVRSLAAVGSHLVLVGNGLWIDGRRQATPATPVAVAGTGNVLLMVTADGLWRATLP